MQTTPNIGLPYAEPGDDLRLYPANVDQPAATILDTRLADTGWVNITISAGFAADAGGAPQVRRIGKIVYCRGGWNSTGITGIGDFNVGVIPAGYLPTSVGVMCVAAGSGGAPAGRFDFGNSGIVRLRVAATGSYYKLVGYCWPID